MKLSYDVGDLCSWPYMYVEFVLLGVLENQVRPQFHPACGMFARMCFDLLHYARKVHYRRPDSTAGHTLVVSHSFLSVCGARQEHCYENRKGQDDIVRLKDTESAFLGT